MTVCLFCTFSADELTNSKMGLVSVERRRMVDVEGVGLLMDDFL